MCLPHSPSPQSGLCLRELLLFLLVLWLPGRWKEWWDQKHMTCDMFAENMWMLRRHFVRVSMSRRPWREPFLVSFKTHLWSRWAFIASVSWRPSLARCALESNKKTVNEKLLKHFSSLIKFGEKQNKTMMLRHQHSLQLGRFFSFRNSTLQLPWDFGTG